MLITLSTILKNHLLIHQLLFISMLALHKISFPLSPIVFEWMANKPRAAQVVQFTLPNRHNGTIGNICQGSTVHCTHVTNACPRVGFPSGKYSEKGPKF